MQYMVYMYVFTDKLRDGAMVLSRVKYSLAIERQLEGGEALKLVVTPLHRFDVRAEWVELSRPGVDGKLLLDVWVWVRV